MASTPKDVRTRIAQATEAAQSAAAVAQKDSRTALDRLKARTPDQRFAALEEGARQLLPEHRRELLKSLRGSDGTAEIPVVRAPVQHASAFEVWRGRLPFRTHRLVRDGLLILCGLLAVGLAYRRTPEAWVELQGSRDAPAAWVMPDGRAVGDRLVAGRVYALMRVSGDRAELREWHPGEGYAETRVPASWLRTRPRANPG